jgi:hypothetical protein
MEKVEEELSETAKKNLFLVDAITMSLGLKNIVREIMSNKYKLEEKNYIKVNLPTSNAKFETGKGEGCWAVPYTKEDLDICNIGARGTSFKVVLLNDAICFPFPYGTILEVECRGGNYRPILNRGWISKTILSASHGAVNFDEMLEA